MVQTVGHTFAKIQYAPDEVAAIAAYAAHDKKNRGDTINCTLLHGLGRGVYDQVVTLAEVRAALAYYAGR